MAVLGFVAAVGSVLVNLAELRVARVEVDSLVSAVSSARFL